MSKKSNDIGRAYEFICLLTLAEKIGEHRSVRVNKGSGYLAAKHAWNEQTSLLQDTLKISSYAAVEQIFELEPRILEDDGDILDLLIQTDTKGKEGDVRDILIIRNSIRWEIGLSLKHNHFAVKHSRLSHCLDFGKKWYGIPCSSDYWNSIKPVFDYLKKEKRAGTIFDDLPNKEEDVYIPILSAFLTEIKKQNKLHNVLPQRMVEYLLGKFDFYKLVSVDRERVTKIQSFNLHGTLNQSSKRIESSIAIPIVSLPKRIVSFDFVPDSTNTLELYMDAGWQFTFRIHNASTKVEPSLKFDIQIVGMPTTIITIDCFWN